MKVFESGEGSKSLIHSFSLSSDWERDLPNFSPMPNKRYSMDRKNFGTMNSDMRNFRSNEVDHIKKLSEQLQGMMSAGDASAAGEIMANFSRFVRTMDITRLLSMYHPVSYTHLTLPTKRIV